jgi:cytochrome c biogenesis protein CcdA
MATNITAVAFISKNLENRNRVFYNGLIYTLGRTVSYTVLAIILFIGADQFKISGVFQQYGEKFIGPILIIIGLFMIGIFNFQLPGFNKLSQKFQRREKYNYWNIFLLGVVFALAFCPYSGVLYFGMLIPITISSAKGLYLPIVFALATGLPVVIFAYLIAFTASGVGKLYNSLQKIEKWFRYTAAAVFIIVGMYYSVIYFI